MPVVLEREIPSAEELVKGGLPIYIGNKAMIGKEGVISIAIVNLMPNKEETEKQILKHLANSGIVTEVTFISLKTHLSKNVSPNYLENYYQTFDEIRGKRLDGMIITGAPLENVEFEAVDYWEELKRIMDYAKDNVKSTLFICWGALAGLYHYYNIPKSLVEKKIFGVFPHYINKKTEIFSQFHEPFWVPQSRYFQLDKELLEGHEEIEILSESSEAGIYAVASKENRQFFLTGHLEYERDTLKREYNRDINKGLKIDKPRHYFPHDNPNNTPKYHWGKNANRFFNNWLQHYVNRV